MEQEIKEFLLNEGADLCGIAHADRFSGAPEGFRPTEVYNGCRSVIVFAKKLPKGLSFVSPRIIYNHATEVNLRELDRLSFAAALKIESMGGVAVPLPSDTPYDYWECASFTGKGVISMRHAAVLAGLGTLGKSTMVLNKTYGNMINFGAVLTNLELRSDELAEEVCQKSCRRCLESCPAKAIGGGVVNQMLCRPHAYGENERGFGVVNCNTCRVVCPLAYGKSH